MTDFGRESFVFDGVEVYKTGRVAEKEVTPLKRKALEKKGMTPDQMIEVRPVDKDMAPFKSKWVEEDKLYKVLPNPRNSEEKVLLER